MNNTDKMKFETSNIIAENMAKIANFFSGVVEEGEVNIYLIRTMLGGGVCVDEIYEFTWVGKRTAIAEVGRPIQKTLHLCPEESCDGDSTAMCR